MIRSRAVEDLVSTWPTHFGDEDYRGIGRLFRVRAIVNVAMLRETPPVVARAIVHPPGQRVPPDTLPLFEGASVAAVGETLAHYLLTTLAEPASDPILPPDTVPHALFDSLGTVMASIPGIEPGPYRRDVVVVRFEPETPRAVRAALLDSIAGRVVGGHVDPDRQNGTYFVRISGGTFDALVHAVDILQRQPQVAYAFWWGLFVPDIQSRRRDVRPSASGWRRAPRGDTRRAGDRARPFLLT